MNKYKNNERSGGIKEGIGYSYHDLTIVPAVISDITSRKQCNVYDENGMLPLFTAPMLSVVNQKNFRIWGKNKINAIAPRTIAYKDRIKHLIYGDWTALSLSEFNELFGNEEFKCEKIDCTTYRVLIDLANGHMHALYDSISKAKSIANSNGYTLIVMTGNIANPETYDWICKHCDVDYIRLSIGTGAGCLTTSNTGTHYPIATLIDECKQIQDKAREDIACEELGDVGMYYRYAPKIVADGGIRNYDDINKALALGADYVMVGSLFAGLLESSADVVIESNDPVKYPAYYDRTEGDVEYFVNYDESRTVGIWNGDTEESKQELIRSMKAITKKYIGMSTKEAQIAVNAALKNPIIASKKDLKTSEGCTKFIPVKYTIAQWVENMIDYLRSAMSYADARNLNEFRNYTYLIVNSPCEVAATNK